MGPSPYRTILIGEHLPAVDPPVQQCLFCAARWGWVNRHEDITYWGVLHQSTCTATNRDKGTT
jgi:hypothetical protein